MCGEKLAKEWIGDPHELVMSGKRMRVAHLLIQQTFIELFVRYQAQVCARGLEIRDTDLTLVEVYLGALMVEVRRLRGERLRNIKADSVTWIGAILGLFRVV